MKGIFPADIDADVGVFTDYFARGQVRTNLAHIQCKQVETRPEAIMSLDILTYALGDSHALNIECFDLKLCTFTRASDRVLQGAQMWCQVGNKDQRLVFSPITLDTNPHRASYLYWDLDRTGQLPATPDPHHLFYVSIPGPGLPYMMHEIYTQEYLIRTWYQEQYEPQFWAVRHRMPTMIENAYWNQDDQRVRFCTHYEEAFWRTLRVDLWFWGDFARWPAVR